MALKKVRGHMKSWGERINYINIVPIYNIHNK